MAISKNELPQYLIDWNEVQGFSKYGYVSRVLEHLKMDDDEKGSNRRKIHNVYTGILRDRDILDGIRAVLLPKSNHVVPVIDRSKIMTK